MRMLASPTRLEAKAEEKMNIGRIIRSIPTILSSDDSDAYFRGLQNGSRPAAPTKDESRRTYIDMLRRRAPL